MQQKPPISKSMKKKARNTIIKNWLPLSVQPILIYVKKLPWQESFLRFSLFASHFSEYLCTRN